MINSDLCPEYRKTAIRAWEFKWEREVSGEGSWSLREKENRGIPAEAGHLHPLVGHHKAVLTHGFDLEWVFIGHLVKSVVINFVNFVGNIKNHPT